MNDANVGLRVSFELQWVDEGQNLVRDVQRVQQMVEAYLSAPPLAAIGMVKIDSFKPKKVTPETRAAVAVTHRKGLVDFYDHPGDKRRAWAQFSMYVGRIELRSVVQREELAKHRATALDDLIAALVRVAEIWRGVAAVEGGAIKFEYLHGDEPPYARLRVPRTNDHYPKRSLVTFLDPRCERRAADVKALTEPPPAHATITNHGELVEVRWAKTLDDQDVAQASTWHDCWIRRLETDVDYYYDARGDLKVVAGNGEPRAPLTFYNPWHKLGFKEVPLTPQGALDPAAWVEACEVSKAGRIGDDEVKKIWIVVPTREQAIAVHARVVAAGFEAAVYRKAGLDGYFWDPLPKGPWLTESTDNAKARS